MRQSDAVSLCEDGERPDHAAVAAHTDIPFGIFHDVTEAVEGMDDLTIPVAIRR